MPDPTTKNAECYLKLHFRWTTKNFKCVRISVEIILVIWDCLLFIWDSGWTSPCPDFPLATSPPGPTARTSYTHRAPPSEWSWAFLLVSFLWWRRLHMLFGNFPPSFFSSQNQVTILGRENRLGLGPFLRPILLSMVFVYQVSNMGLSVMVLTWPLLVSLFACGDLCPGEA